MTKESMNKISSLIQIFLIFRLFYPQLLKYIDQYFIHENDVMKFGRQSNDLPILEYEYQQFFILRFIHIVLFKYIDYNLIDRQTLIKNSQLFNQLFCLDLVEDIEVGKPFAEDKMPIELQAKEGEFRFDKPFAAAVKNINLFGLHAVGITDDSHFILETSLNRIDCLQYSLIASFKAGISWRSTSKVEHFDLVYSLVNYWSPLYSHWILENLTRLETLEYYEQKTGKKPLILIDQDPPLWKLQSLELMGYPTERCHQWNGRQGIVQELVISSKRRQAGRTSIKACAWMRNRILSNLDLNNNSFLTPINSSFIFISRKKASSRRILNEDEVSDCLAKQGFTSYVLEDMTWVDQVKLFANAKCIVAPHGAGVCNMVFSTHADVIIVELFAKKISHAFYALAKGLGFQYGYILCEPVNHDMRVDCKKLTAFLHKIFTESSVSRPNSL